MLLKYGKHINNLATTFISMTFIGFILSTTLLSHYSTPNTFTLLKTSFWAAVFLTIIGFGRERSALAVMLIGICTLALIGLYIFAIIDYSVNPRP
ncbi:MULTISPECIES: hypothetical protein [Bacillus]|uniref:hypothetical protein n=1 Tax=Bacillus TaxID=1386 RepID=UPI001911600F|nr:MULTISPECIES: hypothetical protein [Bacillus]MBK5473093.1 hypothetical protein [Bacillus sp. TH19]WOA58595.1 hypothetical protein RVY74_05810 [Bacillus mycoides]